MEHELKNGIIISIPELHLGVSPWVVKSEKVSFSMKWCSLENQFDVCVNGIIISAYLFDTYNKRLKEMQAACIEANELYQKLLNQ